MPAIIEFIGAENLPKLIAWAARETPELLKRELRDFGGRAQQRCIRTEWAANWAPSRGIDTGYLHSSIKPIPFTVSGDTMETGIMSTGVPYAAVHEFGFSGKVTVRAHQRTMTQAWGRPTNPFVQNVRQHERMMNVREKRFMRNPVEHEADEFETRLVDVLVKFIEKGDNR